MGGTAGLSGNLYCFDNILCRSMFQAEGLVLSVSQTKLYNQAIIIGVDISSKLIVIHVIEKGNSRRFIRGLGVPSKFLI